MESGACTESACVLVARDDQRLGRLLVGILTDAGYRIAPLTDGRKALERLCASVHPLALLLSLRWPPLNSRAGLMAVAADQ